MLAQPGRAARLGRDLPLGRCSRQLLRAPAPPTTPLRRSGAVQRRPALRVAPAAAGRRSAAAAPPPPPAPPVPPSQAPSGNGWRTFWTAVDTSAWLGTVGTAVAFILTQEAMLAGAPIVLPLLALYASRQRERLAAAAESEAQLQRLESLLLDLQAETTDEVAAEVVDEVAQLLRAAQQAQQRQAAGGGAAAEAEAARLLAKLESKLSAVEGSVLSAGATTRDALAASVERQGQLANSVMSRLQDLGTALRRDINAQLAEAGGQDAAALGSLEARLASLERSIEALAASQGAGLQQLGGGLSAALQDAVREEAYRSLDPLRRLPELLQSALPVTPEVVVGPESALPSLSEESLRRLVGEQVGAAVRQLADQQEELLEELRGQPQLIAPQQWNQLGGRLGSLQEQLERLSELQAAASENAAAAAAAAEGQAGGGQAGGAEVAAVAAELAGVRSDLASLTGSVQRLLEAQQQQSAAAGSGSMGAAAGGMGSMPPGVLAAVAAAVQAVQDQVVLLREEMEESDSRYATFSSLEEQLEVALTSVFEVVVDQRITAAAAASGGSTGSAAASDTAAAAAAEAASAAAAAAVEQQAAALNAALDSLAGLGQRLDGMSEQLAALAQAGVGAGVAAGAAAASAGEQPAAGSTAGDAAEAAGSEDADGAKDAYRRMQAKLRERSAAGAPALPEPSGPAFAEWLSGHRENSPQPATTGAGASSSSSSNGAGGLQQQIDFAAAMGMVPSEEETAPEWQQQQQAAAAPAARAAAGAPAAAWPAAAEQPPAYNGAAPAQPAEQAWQPQPGFEQQAGEQWNGAEWQAQPPAEPQQWQPQAEQQWQAPAQDAAWQQEQQAAPWAAQAVAEPAVAAMQPLQQAPVQQAPIQQQAAAAPPPVQVPPQQVPPQQAEQLYETGVQRLKEGRALAATSGADLGLADAAFWEAARSFEGLLAGDPNNLRALGNYGNTLLAHGKLKKQLMEAVTAAAAPADAAQAAAVAAAQRQLAEEARELLLLAGRQYKAVLELDPGQAKAFINWGRVLGLRAEMARGQGDLAQGTDLFGRAADKFDAALDLEPQNAQATRLAAQALLESALCMLPADPREARSTLKDAASYFESFLAADPSDGEAAAGLRRCEAELAALRAAREAEKRAAAERQQFQ